MMFKPKPSWKNVKQGLIPDSQILAAVIALFRVEKKQLKDQKEREENAKKQQSQGTGGTVQSARGGLWARLNKNIGNIVAASLIQTVN
ncbi:MAG: hypothetical protein EZS28_043959 [Streblomastix strix]|uniref:Uncharacterized protein n=1 Tax=Streblomastix strix TaxID=222440 RepID=A0A5J4TPZ3_9EUKA|nr:MAG: hypothetical protein EZS28_043959 [Streblomastix strix]